MAQEEYSSGFVKDVIMSDIPQDILGLDRGALLAELEKARSE